MATGDGQFDTQALPYQIKVMEGEQSVAQLQANQPLGTIQLVGRSGPLRPIKYKGKQRVKTTFYPGNPNGSQQVLGPTLEPSVVNFDWSDRYLGDGQARALWDVLEDLKDRGVTVEVSWGGPLSGGVAAPNLTGSSIVRVGVIGDIESTIDRNQDILLEVIFEWRSKGAPAAGVNSATATINPRQDLGNVVDDLQLASSLWDAFAQGPSVAVTGLPQQLLADVGLAQDTIGTAVDAIQNASAAIATATVIPQQAALRLIGACSNGIAALNTMESRLLAIPFLAVEVRDSALDLLTLHDNVFDQLGQVRDAKESCYDARAGVQAIAQSDIIAQVRAPAGTDLRDLSLKYYGTADLWWAIANFNNIDGSAVPSPPGGPSDDPARPINIPRIQPGASSDLRQQC